MSKIAILGITGRVGSRLATELSKRGHIVTGIARKTEGLAAQPGLTVKAGDATDTAGLVPLLKDHDAVIRATRFVGGGEAAALVAALKQAGVPRLLVVGGAGSLEVAPGVAAVDTPSFPEAYKPEALAGRDFLHALRKETQLDWTFLSPSAELMPGERTGSYRKGGEQMLFDAKGTSHISMEDYAIAMSDELEQPRHSRQRFTVGY